MSPVPTCRLTGGWEKQPGGFNVQRIQFTGAVWCPSTPSDLGAAARVRVTDLTGNPLKQPVIDVSGGLSGQPGSSESVSLTPVLYGPRPGHQYLFEFFAGFWSWQLRVGSAPWQCSYSYNQDYPVSDGPDPSWGPPAEDCHFYQQIAVP